MSLPEALSGPDTTVRNIFAPEYVFNRTELFRKCLVLSKGLAKASRIDYERSL